MLDTILITLLIVAICIVLLGVKVFFVKGGRFPNGHVSGNKAMRDRGIGCVQSQDREAQRKSRFRSLARHEQECFEAVKYRLECVEFAALLKVRLYLIEIIS